MRVQMLVHGFGGPAADFRVAGVFVVPQLVTGRFIELRQQVESDIRRLIVEGIGAGYVMAERTQRGLPREWLGTAAGCEFHGVQARREAGGDGFHVALHAGNLAGKEDFGPRAQLQGGREQGRRIDVGVAMNLTEAEELRMFQSRNHAQDAGLLAELQMVLEADQVEAIGAQVFLAELHGGPGTAARARIDQSHGLHGAEAQRIAAAAGEFLDRQASFEIGHGFIGQICRDVGGDGLGGQQGVHERFVLRAVEGAVEVIRGAIERLVVARSPESDGLIDRIGFHNRADAVVKEQAAGTGEASDFLGQRIAGQGAGGDDGDAGDAGVRHFADLLAADFDARMPTMMLTGTFPARVPAGTRTSTCITPATAPSTPPAYRTSAGWPSTTACTLSVGLGRGEDPALPSTPAGEVSPSPVANSETVLPAGAGAFAILNVPLSLSAAACPLPPASDVNRPGESAATCTWSGALWTPWYSTTTCNGPSAMPYGTTADTSGSQA